MTVESFYGSSLTVERIWKLIEKDAQALAESEFKHNKAMGLNDEMSLDKALKIKGQYIENVVKQMRG